MMRCVRFVFLALVVFGFCVQEAGAGRRSYKIAFSFPFPPFSVGPLEGVNFDLLAAICTANQRMRCKIVNRPQTDCIDSDAAGNLVIGQGLTKGEVDGCIGWFITDERKRLGGEFSEPYSTGTTPQLIASNDNSAFDGLGATGSLTGAEVGFIRGFFSDPKCLEGNYNSFSSVLFDSGQAGKDAIVAALLARTIDLVFWDNTNTVPEGTHLVGEAVRDCGPALAMLGFPTSKKRRNKSDRLRRDFNCGLALIRANGMMKDICANSQHPGGDPACILEGPPPTVQCLAE